MNEMLLLGFQFYLHPSVQIFL